MTPSEIAALSPAELEAFKTACAEEAADTAAIHRDVFAWRYTAEAVSTPAGPRAKSDYLAW
jgi:hypothetical protein